MKWTDRETGKEVDIYASKEFLEDVQGFNDTACQHERTEVRKSRLNNGAIQYRHQCTACGELVGNAISKSQVPNDARDVDYAFRKNCEDDRSELRDDLYQKHIQSQRKEGVEFDIRYAAYLKSNSWLEKREKVFKRSNGLCEGCLSKRAVVVHHLHYDHVFDELLFELVALCSGCHEKCHPHLIEGPCNGCRSSTEDQLGRE